MLDGHRDKVVPNSISDSFGGFHIVVDGKTNYPFMSRNGFPIKTGQANEILIKATKLLVILMKKALENT